MRLRSFLVLSLTTAVFTGSLLLSEALEPVHEPVPLLWLPIGIAYAAVAFFGPWFTVPIVLVSVADGLLAGYGLWQTALYAAGAAASVLAIRALVRRFGLLHGERLQDTVVRVSSSAVGAAIGATTMGAALGWWYDWPHLFLSQLAGVLVTAPVARSCLRRGGRGVASKREGVAMLATTALLAEAVGSGALGLAIPLPYLLFPPVVWAALRTGRRGVGAASFLVAVISAANTAAGHGPFASSGDPTLRLDTFLVVLTLTGLLLVGIENSRRATEASLRSSEERFRAMIENATDLVCVFAPDRTIRYHSPSAERILGYTPAALVGRDIRDFIHPDDYALVEAHIAEATDASAHVRFRRRDGRWLELEGHARDLSDNPAIGGVLVNARDVTEARAAERRYRELVERLPLAIYLRQLDGSTPMYMSPQIETLLGYPPELWVDQPEMIFDLIHPEDRERVAPWLADDRSLSQLEFRVRAADGRYLWVLNQRSPIRDASGELVGYQGCVVDITEQKRLEEQLRQAQRLESLGLLAGGVAHDFNNLLTAISGYTELVQRRLADDPQAHRDLGEVLVAAARASDLTQQLLAFGRRQTLVASVMSLNEVVARTQRMLTRAIDERVQVVCNLDPGLHLVRADTGQIEQVIVNLALNARDAMPDGGTLTIATSNAAVMDEHGSVPPGDYAIVEVADTGAGFDDDVRERLFEPFFTTKGIGKGTGLGLAVVFGIVEQSRGHILVDSEPGIGSRFRVLLPRTYDLVPDAPPPLPPPAAAPGTETILLVEDEAVVRQLTTTMLEASGYRVLAAATPHEALAVEEPYDLLVTDVVMPGLSGPELWQRLRAEGRPAAVLFTSGYSAAVVGDGDGLPGDLLEKPFSADELARRVRAALDGQHEVRPQTHSLG